MTLWDLILAMFRRWPVVLAGAIITGALGLLAVQDHGLYWTRTKVILLAPTAWYPNRLEASPWEVTKATAVVVKRVVGAGTTIRYASPDATMVGTSDVQEGAWIRQEDDGGQWSIGLTSPVIIVDAVGPTPERAREQQQAATSKITSTLAQMQKDWRVDPDLRITATVTPASSIVYRVTGSRVRALGMTGALGIGATVGVVLALEYLARRRPEGAAGVRASGVGRLVKGD